jgi:hypothetical protein
MMNILMADFPLKFIGMNVSIYRDDCLYIE